jgi:hypothetical protein
MKITELSHFSAICKPWKTYEACPTEVVEKYAGVLPEILINTWRDDGFQQFSNGFLWSVNPDEYRDVVADFIYEPQRPDAHVLFRTAFGDLIFQYKSKMFHLSAVTLRHGELGGALDLVLEVHLGQRDFANSIFFLKEFRAARKALGDLTSEEVYGLVPAAPLGGTLDIQNMQKVNLKAHLHFLSQFVRPQS